MNVAEVRTIPYFLQVRDEMTKTPVSLQDLSRTSEPNKNCRTSWDHLLAFQPESEAIQKAKNFWTDVDSYKVDAVAQEILREQVKEEARALHTRVCKWHVRIFHEREFNVYYHYPATTALLKEDPVYCLLSNDPDINAAGRNIYDEINIPENFQTWMDFCVLYPDPRSQERATLAINRICEEPFEDESVAGLEQAKKYWTTHLSDEEASSIKQNYPLEVGRLRELFWKRHLTCSHLNELYDKNGESQMNALKNYRLKMMCAAIATTSTIAGTLFFFSR